MFLTEQQAPRRCSRTPIASTGTTSSRRRRCASASPPARRQRSRRLWEERYAVFDARAAARRSGRAIVVEEIGKHRPITFVVGVQARTAA